MPLQWASTSNSVIPPQPGSGASSVRGILGSCALFPLGVLTPVPLACVPVRHQCLIGSSCAVCVHGECRSPGPRTVLCDPRRRYGSSSVCARRTACARGHVLTASGQRTVWADAG